MYLGGVKGGSAHHPPPMQTPADVALPLDADPSPPGCRPPPHGCSLLPPKKVWEGNIFISVRLSVGHVITIVQSVTWGPMASPPRHVQTCLLGTPSRPGPTPCPLNLFKLVHYVAYTSGKSRISHTGANPRGEAPIYYLAKFLPRTV